MTNGASNRIGRSRYIPCCFATGSIDRFRVVRQKRLGDPLFGDIDGRTLTMFENRDRTRQDFVWPPSKSLYTCQIGRLSLNHPHYTTANKLMVVLMDTENNLRWPHFLPWGIRFLPGKVHIDNLVHNFTLENG